MHARLKADWIAALRNGKYTQFKGALENALIPNNCCCLGVLCNVAGLQKSYHPNNNDVSFYYTGSTDEKYLPWVFAEAIGFNSMGTLPAPFQNRCGNPIHLTELNDSGEFSFDQIADIIQYVF